MINSRSRRLQIALLSVGIATLGTPSHAGFLDKIKNKMDKVTEKVTDKTDKVLAPVAEANQKVIDAQNQAMAPVVQGQQKMNEMQQKAMAPVVRGRQMVGGAMAPVTNARGAMASMQNGLSPAGLKQQLLGAAGMTDRVFLQDAALRRFKLDSVASPNFKSLRLIGTVNSSAARARAQALAARQFPGTIVNEIRVVPLAAKMSAKSKLRAVSAKQR